MRFASGLHAHCPNQVSHVSAATTSPTDEHTESWNGRTLSSPAATKDAAGGDRPEDFNESA